MSEQSDENISRSPGTAETMLPFGQLLEGIVGTDQAVVAAYRTDDPTPPGPEVKREHYWVTHDGDRFVACRRSNGVGQAGSVDFEDAYEFLEEPDNPIYDYDHVVTRVVSVKRTPIPYKRAGKRRVECPECDAFVRVHAWKLDNVADECGGCGYGGEFNVER